MCFTCLEIFRLRVFIFTSDVLREPCFKTKVAIYKTNLRLAGWRLNTNISNVRKYSYKMKKDHLQNSFLSYTPNPG